MWLIAVTNQSTVLSNEQVAHATIALEQQMGGFCEAWGLGKTAVQFFPKGRIIPSAALVLVILDDTDQANALGYHFETDLGTPMARVFARTDLQNNRSWTVTASHEALEMRLDPYDQLIIQQGNNLYAYECCDAVEDDQSGYMIGDVLVSDFIIPAYFHPESGSKFFDWNKKLTAALSATPGSGVPLIGTVTTPPTSKQKSTVNVFENK